MKRNKIILFVIFSILTALLIACFCSSCDFVQYVKKSENDLTITEEFTQLQNNYIDKLCNETSAIKYRENEQILYDYAIQDAINELNECRSESDLKQVYNKHFALIGEIKTEEEYLREEEANEINAYRAAILTQAEASYDKQKYVESQIVYLDSIFLTFYGNISDTDVKEEMNGLLQSFYFDIHKEDEILGMLIYADISAYETSQKNILTDTLDGCIENIRNCNSEDVIEEQKNVYKLEVYKRETIKKITEYVDLNLYRDVQVKEIVGICAEYLTLAEKVDSNLEADNAFREYQIAVYDIPTDEMLYSVELAELKNELKESFVNSYKLSSYRENEAHSVHELLQFFQDSLEIIKEKEDVLSQYIIVKNRLDSVKTASVLDAEDRANLIEELYSQILDEVDKNVDESEKDKYLSKAEIVYSAMCDRISLEGIRQEYRTFVQEIAYAYGAILDILKGELKEFNNSVFYREKEQNHVNALKEEYLTKFTDDLGVEGAKTLLEEAKKVISEIKTNDDLWNDTVSEFKSKLNSLYGNSILEEPESLTEANNYFELAKIIDYYAFYQLSDEEFVCGEFRVKINFEHNDALWERNEVYWYCELIRSALGITAEFESENYLVFNLIPYKIASESNRKDVYRINRYKNVIEFDSDKSAMTVRADDFDDFAYYNYEKTISIWNSQQLWYALEHEYVPVCVENSPAELVLNSAKEILREIIMEGMSDKEKIFRIYSWFGENVQFDNSYWKYLGSSDLDMFPDEQAATLKSLHAEGALLEGLAVCESYAKAYLILLRLEGIESYRIFIRDNNLKGINSINAQKSINYGGYGSHAFCIIGLEGKYYYSDTEKTFVAGRETLQSIQQLLAPPSLSAGSLRGFTYMYKDLNYDEELSDIYSMLKVNSEVIVNNIDDFKSIIDDFRVINGSRIQLTVIFVCEQAEYDGMYDALMNELSEFDYLEKSVSDTKYILKEFIVYK